MLALLLALSVTVSPRLWVGITSELNFRIKHTPRADARVIHIVMDDGMFLRATTEQLDGEYCPRTHFFRWIGPFHTSTYTFGVFILDGAGKVLEQKTLEIGMPPPPTLTSDIGERN